MTSLEEVIQSPINEKLIFGEERNVMPAWEKYWVIYKSLKLVHKYEATVVNKMIMQML